jgi:hydrogenase maturation factor
VRIVCEAFGLDPVSAIAEGSLLITAHSHDDYKVIDQLKNKGIAASVIGKVTLNVQKRTMKRVDGRTVPLEIPAQDPFWPAFFKGLA